MNWNTLNSLNFTKMTGAGNDFLFVKEAPLPTEKRAPFVKNICHRHFGIGADGFVFIEPPTDTKAHFRWDFYNSDGSSAEMCGNAARCVALYMHKLHHLPSKMCWEASPGIIEASILSDHSVKVSMPALQLLKSKQSWVMDDQSFSYDIVDSGVPHFVIPLNDSVSIQTQKKIAQDIQSHHSTNVTFYEILSSDRLKVKTFERGVKDFTLACGTGAMAAAFIHGAPKGSVTMPGGVLDVEQNKNQNFLSGPAQFIAHCQLEDHFIESLKRIFPTGP